jgi:hypothetical protein
MKTEYNIKDTVWIHNGERTLVQGRIVEIIDLEHLEEGHDPERELYVIELKTGIDDIYEVRSFEQISPDEHGPIGLFRKEDVKETNRALKKIGMPLPQGVMDYEPTPDEIHAALQRSQDASKHVPLNAGRKTAPKKRYFKKKVAKND